MNNYENEEFKILNEGLMSIIEGKSKYSILIYMIPETNRIGNPYFKVYDRKKPFEETRVARVSFLKPELITGHSNSWNQTEWKLENFNSKIRKELVSYLNERAKDEPGLTLWTYLKTEWNKTLNISFDKKKYGDVEYDKNF